MPDDPFRENLNEEYSYSKASQSEYSNDTVTASPGLESRQIPYNYHQLVFRARCSPDAPPVRYNIYFWPNWQTVAGNVHVGLFRDGHSWPTALMLGPDGIPEQSALTGSTYLEQPLQLHKTGVNFVGGALDRSNSQPPLEIFRKSPSWTWGGLFVMAALCLWAIAGFVMLDFDVGFLLSGSASDNSVQQLHNSDKSSYEELRILEGPVTKSTMSDLAKMDAIPQMRLDQKSQATTLSLTKKKELLNNLPNETGYIFTDLIDSLHDFTSLSQALMFTAPRYSNPIAGDNPFDIPGRLNAFSTHYKTLSRHVTELGTRAVEEWTKTHKEKYVDLFVSPCSERLVLDAPQRIRQLLKEWISLSTQVAHQHYGVTLPEIVGLIHDLQRVGKGPGVSVPTLQRLDSFLNENRIVTMPSDRSINHRSWSTRLDSLLGEIEHVYTQIQDLDSCASRLLHANIEHFGVVNMQSTEKTTREESLINMMVGIAHSSTFEDAKATIVQLKDMMAQAQVLTHSMTTKLRNVRDVIRVQVQQGSVMAIVQSDPCNARFCIPQTIELVSSLEDVQKMVSSSEFGHRRWMRWKDDLLK